MAAKDAAVESIVADSAGLEITCRKQGEKTFCFVMNFKEEERKLPAVFAGKTDLLKGNVLTETTTLKKYDVFLVEI